MSLAIFIDLLRSSEDCCPTWSAFSTLVQSVGVVLLRLALFYSYKVYLHRAASSFLPPATLDITISGFSNNLPSLLLFFFPSSVFSRLNLYPFSTYRSISSLAIVLCSR